MPGKCLENDPKFFGRKATTTSFDYNIVKSTPPFIIEQLIGRIHDYPYLKEFIRRPGIKALNASNQFVDTLQIGVQVLKVLFRCNGSILEVGGMAPNAGKLHP